MTEVTHLVARDVARAAVLAYEEGRLCMQNQDKHYARQYNELGNSFYGHPAIPGIGCAVGVALSLEEAYKTQKRSGYRIGGYIADGFFTADEPAALGLLQKKHDDWDDEGSDFIKYARELAGLAEGEPA